MSNEKWEAKKFGMSRNLISLGPRIDQSEVTPKKKLFNLFYFRSGICAINLKIADSNQIGSRSSKDVHIC